nr:hypothetical protein [Dechloromonas sp.]
MTVPVPPPRWRFPLLLMAMASLLFGVLGGLARVAIEVPVLAQARASGHGALMIAGFFGTVISLERAVALHRAWPYLAPLAAGLGGAALIAAAPWWVAPALFCQAGTILFLASLQVYRQLPALFTLTLLLGASAWLAGNFAWLANGDPTTAVPFWMLFLILTIAGERLELTRFLPPRPLATRLFGLLLGLICLAASALPFTPEAASRLLAGCCLALALWLIRNDIARRTIRQDGLPRFVAACLLAGYAWLALGGALGLLGAFAAGHAWRDAALHAIFVGFVFSMVIGHAPIIFPAVMQVRIPYTAWLYLPLLALHTALLLRVAGGLAADWPWRQNGTLATALSLALFILSIAGSVWHGRSSAGQAAS